METLYAFTEADVVKIRDRFRDSPDPPRPPESRGGRERHRDVFPFKCTAACPAHGVMRVTGVELDENKFATILTAKPNTTFYRYYFVCDDEAALSDGEGNYLGYGTFLEHAGHVLYDTANTPAFGETWGPANDTWTIAKNRWGFDILGGTSGTGSESKVWCVQRAVNHLLGKTNASHAKGASGTVNLYAGTLGSETQVTSMTVTAWNRFAEVGSGKWVHVSWIPGGWDLSAAECG